MKNIFKMRYLAVMFLSLSMFCLVACGTKDNVENTEDENNNDIIVNEEKEEQNQQEDSDSDSQETGENDTSVQDTDTSDTTLSYDIKSELSRVENEVEILEKKLYEDETLKQSDMNDLSYDIYVLWDDLLNDMWKVIKENLDEESMDELLKEQREWIDEKEKAVKEAGNEYAGGSMAPLVSNQKAAELTKERVYELVPYLSDL